MTALLLVEDDEKIGALLVSALTSTGHRISWQRTGASALVAAQGQAFDLVLLDLGLPDVDGVDLCRGLRRCQPETVIVILTARRDEIDVIVGLESGADDYLIKPFRLTELLARVRAHLRRHRPADVISAAAPLRLGDLIVDVDARRCWVGGEELQLRLKEFDLLARLARSEGSAVSRTTLMADVWDDDWFGQTKTLDVHIAALRRRLAEASRRAGGARLPSITTLRGHGYRLDAPEVLAGSPSSQRG